MPDSNLQTASGITGHDLEALRQAKLLLENPGLAARLTDLVGRPIETGLNALPKAWAGRITGILHATLGKALDVSIATVGRDAGKAQTGNRFHNVLAMASGAAGGAFGLAALPVELPVSTTIILRSIANVALREGEDLSSMEARLACLSVLAMGGKTRGDDSAETGYWAVRSLLANAVTDAAKHLAQKSVSAKSAPAIVRFIALVAARFQIRVSQQIAAKAVPVIGAVAGAGVNAAFTNHFQEMARGHFTVRRLERTYGKEAVKAAYLMLPSGKNS